MWPIVFSERRTYEKQYSGDRQATAKSIYDWNFVIINFFATWNLGQKLCGIDVCYGEDEWQRIGRIPDICC
ncbi:hypothetical protein D3C85_1736470 [compost metagenome]